MNSRFWFLTTIIAMMLFASQALEIRAHDDHKADPRAIGAIMTRFSDDGESLACSYQGSIWRISRSDGQMTRLTKTGRGFDIEPTWSHDGNRMAFIRSTNFFAGRLELIDARSGESIPLPVEVSASGRLFFDSANKRVLGAFQLGNARPRFAWYDLATGTLEDAVSERNWPASSHDGLNSRRLVFAAADDLASIALVTTADVPGEQTGNQGPQCVVWRVSLKNEPPKKIVTWPARIHELCWKSDGRSLIVATERGGVHHDLWEVPIDDPERSARKLTFAQADESSPDTSADGRWLCYTDNRHGSTMVVVRDWKTDRDSILEPTKFDFGTPSGFVSLRVMDAKANHGITARVTVRDSRGKQFAPSGALYRLLGEDLHFYLHDHAKWELPVGQYTATAVRGPESEIATTTWEIRPGEVTNAVLKVARWTNQRESGWVSGESHIHANYGYGHWYCTPDSMHLQCDGEDLTVANLMVANSDGDGVFDREFFLGKPDPRSSANTILYWNEEFRATIWGHMTLLNLKHLVTPIYTGFKQTTHPHDVPTNADIADHVHDQDGHVNYTHPAHSQQDPYHGAYTAKEMPIDVALGKVDSMDIMSNQNANMAVWYRLLNCGLRLPAAAGTDCFLNRIPSVLPGAVRVYVHCPEKFTYESWIKNLRAGRTFATNGPMLRFSVNGQEQGSTLAFPKTTSVVVSASVIARSSIDSLELVINGKVQPLSPPNGKPSKEFKVEQSIELTQSCWIALRAQNSSGAFAHTSPVYVTIAEQPLHSAEDAKFFMAWIERLRRDVRQRNQIPARHIPHVDGQLDKALEFYRQQTTIVNAKKSQ